MTKTRDTLIVGAVTLLAAANAHAYQTFFGEDLSSLGVPLASTPNSSAKATAFQSLLIGVGTEDFEGIAAGTSAPLALNFPGAGTATLTGGSGQVVAVTPGTSNAGRYSIPSPSSSNYWDVSAGGGGDFSVAFGSTIAALGFYGIDIGDFGGQLQLQLSNGDVLTVPNTIGTSGSTDGSVLFFGLIAQSAAEEFNSVNFLTTTGEGDVFGFDRFTIGSQQQVCTPGVNCPTVPEPATLALLGLSFAGLALSRRRKVH